MRQKPIAEPSKALNLACTTEKHSAGLKNTYKFHELGLFAEAHVKEFFVSRGWIIQSERFKYDGVEVDLIVQKQNRKLLIEVKSLDNSWRSFERVGSKQIQRLRFALLGMRHRERQLKIEGYIVFVLRDRNLSFVSIDELM